MAREMCSTSFLRSRCPEHELQRPSPNCSFPDNFESLEVVADNQHAFDFFLQISQPVKFANLEMDGQAPHGFAWPKAGDPPRTEDVRFWKHLEHMDSSRSTQCIPTVAAHR